MNEIDYIGPNELIFNNDIENGIHAGGFNVKSLMLKEGISPIITLNNNMEKNGIGSGLNQVSDLFNNLVIPSWTLSYHNHFSGGSNIKNNYKKNDDSDYESEDDIIDDDIHDKLLDLVKEHEIKQEEKKKRKTKKHTTKERKRKTRKNNK